MSWVFSPSAIAQIVTAAVLAGVAYLAWLHRAAPGGRWLCLFMVAVAEWSFFEGLQAAAVGIPAKVLLSQIEYPGLASGVPLMLMFVLAFVGLERVMTRPRLLLLWSVPVITVVLVATNHWHRLIWNDFVPVQGSNLIIYIHGAWFWFIVGYYHLLVMAAAGVLIWAIAHMPGPYRRQAVVMLLGVPLPWLGNVLYVLDVVPGLDWTPICLGLTGVILTWGMYRLGLLELVPAARHTLVESMRDGVLVLDGQDRVVDINPAARSLIRATAVSPIGQPVEAVLAAWPELLTLCRQAGETQGDVALRGDPLRWVDVRTSPLCDHSGRLTGRLVVLRDVTAHRCAEHEMRRLRDLHESIVHTMSEGVAITDVRDCVAFVNPAAAAILGYAPIELVGQQWNVIVPPDRWPVVEAANHRRTQGLIDQYEVELMRKDGTRLPVLVAGSPFCDPETGAVTGTLAVFTSITELKRAESELRQAKEAAETANRAKSQFVANISHEMRTPMNAVIGATGLLLDSELTLRQRDLVETARNSAEALLGIINDVLDFSKIESGQLELENHPFVLSEVIEQSLDVVSLGAASKNLDLLYAVGAGVPAELRGDATRLRQVLINLLGNAVKFTEFGQVVVRVERVTSASACPTEPLELHTTVTDSGIGIPQDKVSHLFKPFSQVDASITRRYGGTGLGLVICRRLVERMNGRIWAESAGVPGQGAAFHFTVFLEQATDAEVPAAANLVGGLAGKRVLVADDNPVMRDYLVQLLQSAGIVVRPVASATEAVDALSEATPPCDAIALDCTMPEEDGVAIASLLRRGAASSIPIILLAPPGKTCSKADEMPFAAVVSKPIKPAQLMAELGRLLGGSAPCEVATAPARRRRPEVQGPKRPMRILLAEDNLVNQKVTIAMLRRLGIQEGADVAANGLEALQAVLQQRYDVVLMDVHMPEMDGLAATRAIRAQLSPEQQPYIIAITAAAMQGDAEHCMAAGMNAYVSKPMRLEDLAEALSKVPGA